MSLIYLQLARLADEDRIRDLSTDARANRRAAMLRSAAACCRRTITMRVRGMIEAVRGRLAPRPALVCC